MIRYESECVDCGKPCIDTCRFKHVPHVVCDGCGLEDIPTWNYNGDHLCETCLLDAVKGDCDEVRV